jgi:hypothetical protein
MTQNEALKTLLNGSGTKSVKSEAMRVLGINPAATTVEKVNRALKTILYGTGTGSLRKAATALLGLPLATGAKALRTILNGTGSGSARRAALAVWKTLPAGYAVG